MGQDKPKRRKYFLKDSSQPKLIFKTYLILLSIMLVTAAAFYFLGNKNLSEEFYKAHSQIKNTMQIFLPVVILVNIAGLLGAFFLVVTFTHSIAGPIYRLKILSARIAEGDLAVQVKFREKDMIQELSGIINDITKGLASRLKEFEAPLNKLQELSSKVSNMDTLPPDELHNLKSSLSSVTTDLEKKLKGFKL